MKIKSYKQFNEGFLNDKLSDKDILYQIDLSNFNEKSLNVLFGNATDENIDELKNLDGEFIVPKGGGGEISGITRWDSGKIYTKTGSGYKYKGDFSLSNGFSTELLGEALGELVKGKDDNEKPAEYRDSNNKKVRNPDFDISKITYKLVRI